MKFPCIECGLCCRRSEQVPELSQLMTPSGCCRYFDEKTSLCRIYLNRPDVCNVAKMYELHFSHCMSEKEFIRKNLEVCLALNQAAGQAENCKCLKALIQHM